MPVATMLREMPASELTEWWLYDRIEPFGEWRADLRAGTVAAAVYNVQRRRGSRAIDPRDFIPRFETKEQDKATRTAMLKAMFRQAAQEAVTHGKPSSRARDPRSRRFDAAP